MIVDDVTDQTIHRRVFATVRHLIRQRIAVGRAVTYIDATNLTRRERRQYVRLGQLYDEALAPTGLRGTQVSLLTQIDAMTLPTNRGNAAGPTLQELASRLSLRVSHVSHVDLLRW